MLKWFKGFLSIGLTVCAMTAGADPAMPPDRFVVSTDTDFPGADLDALFDTDLDSCIRACDAQSACTAFTFNMKSNACFPKSAAQDRIPFVGALSAEKIPAPHEVRNRAETRAQDLGFVQDHDRKGAYTQAKRIGLLHRAGGKDAATLVDSARIKTNALAASSLIGAAISLTDLPFLWTEYASLLLNVRENNYKLRRDYATRALQASINGYLRSETKGERTAALVVMANALQRLDRGRESIPALRLAQQLQPRDDLQTALDKAIAKYGFRVDDTLVDSDSVAPRICVEFTEDLVRSGLDYDPFVQRDPGLAVQAEGRNLCIDGVEHGKRYRLTLRQGLPSESGETLYRDVELTHYVRDRSPVVRFPGRSYVLPKSADAALPVETVNLTELDLRLRRVSDRNLLRAVQDGYFGRPLSNWEDKDFAKNIAEEIWTGTAKVQSELNQAMTTRLPLGDALRDLPAGIYALSANHAGADPYDDSAAMQWFVLSDLGLSTLSGTDGLHVSVRGLSDARARAGVTVSLISRANAVLAEAQTDAEGLVRFDPGLTRGTGGASPAMVIAQAGDEDLAFLSLTDPAFDLSDRGVEGRAPAGPVDVFLTTDRGAYRAGETIHVTALSRDSQSKAIEGLPLIAVLKRPDGVEYRRMISGGGQAGGHVFALPVGADAPRGTWRLEMLSDPKAPPLAAQSVLVEDFLPERIDFIQSLPNAPLFPGDSPPLIINARYLFGAPGADLSIDGRVRLRATSTLKDWPGYRFGLHDAERRTITNSFAGDRTDAAGQASVAVELPQSDAVGQPLEATVITHVADGSARPVERRLTVPVRPATPVIGIKPLFDDVVREGTEAAFDLIALSPDLKPEPLRVKWTLNRLHTRYQWYQIYGDWEWEPITRRTAVASGEMMLGGDPMPVSAPVDWGEYELVVERLDGDYVASSTKFYAGWYVTADASASPDRLEMSLDRADYVAGDTAKLRIVPRYAGTALITVMSDHVIARKVVEVPEGETLIPLDVTGDWGTGAYVTATVIRPTNVSAGQNPARSLGVAHAAIDPGVKRLSVSIDAPELARPRATQPVRVRVDGAQDGERVWLTLAAIDEGILSLTGFTAPDPSGHYFGQRRLGVEMRDLYGRLIDGMNGAMGQVRSGGDAGNAMRMQSPPPTQDLMATFSGAVEVVNGEAMVDVPLPPFNGNVRLMAVAWSDTGVGQDSADMLVRDPVVVAASVPRFLAPGDEARMLLDVTHADGPTGQMQLALTSGDGVQIGAAPAMFDLGQGEKASFAVPLTAEVVGDTQIAIALTTPDGTVLQQTLTLPVRANDPVIASTRRFALGAGDRFEFTADVFADLRPGTGKALLTAGSLARFDVPGLLSALDRYPYGCTEQVTSQAMPLLYLSSVAQASGLGTGPDLSARIDQAIGRVLTRQASNGAFGLWRADYGDFWLDAYVTDFLSRARAKGHAVPERAFATALDNLRNRVNYAPDFDEGGQDIAYALMVLAREGAAAMGDLRYYADVKGSDFDTPLAAAQLGAALAAYGDQLRADRMFSRAARMIDAQDDEAPVWRADYGTNLRDRMGALALATESGSAAIQPAAFTRPVARMSTQEASWSLLAAHALTQSAEQSGLLVNGAPVSGPFVEVWQDQDLAEPFELTSTRDRAIEITLTTTGVPTVAPPAGGMGYSIDRAYYSLEGERLLIPSFGVGDRFVAVITVKPHETGGARLMIDDPLPAGFEIDNPSLLQSGDIRALDWLEPSVTENTEFRADRFLAAVDHRGSDTIQLAYVLRAVTPGSFHHPAASVEDMYRPQFRARSDTGRVDIQP